MDVNEWINNECAESMLPHLNIPNWFTHSHLSKGKNHARNRSEITRVNGPLERPLHYFPVSHSLLFVTATKAKLKAFQHKNSTESYNTVEEMGSTHLWDGKAEMALVSLVIYALSWLLLFYL